MDAFTVADWFIAHNNAVMKYNSADEMSNLKMQKLLYYAQGCALASYGKVLFDEDIVAWKHGPVVEKIYQKYHQYGRGGITEVPECPSFDIQTEVLLINTYNAFARYSAWELANLTHTEDPWKYTPLNEVISTLMIKNYFLSHYKNVNDENELTENIEMLREIEKYEADWDGEGGLPFESTFIQDVIDLISTMIIQPDIGATGRGSIDLEYGSLKKGKKYLGLEIFEKDRRVHVYSRNGIGQSKEWKIGMEDVNGCVQQF